MIMSARDSKAFRKFMQANEYRCEKKPARTTTHQTKCYLGLQNSTSDIQPRAPNSSQPKTGGRIVLLGLHWTMVLPQLHSI